VYFSQERSRVQIKVNKNIFLIIAKIKVFFHLEKYLFI